MSDEPHRNYRVERYDAGGGQVEVALVEAAPVRRRWRRDTTEVVRTLARRAFVGRDVVAIAAYQAQLEQAGRLAARGQYGCYVDVDRQQGEVRVLCVERAIEGERLRTEILAERH